MLSLFNNFDLQMNGAQVAHVQSRKYLGVTIYKKGSWKPYRGCPKSSFLYFIGL